MNDDGRDFWERTAQRYDLSMRLLGGPLDAMLPMVRDEVRGMDRVLELAAGTGLVPAALAPDVGEVWATDDAEGMVAALDARVAALGLDNVQTRQLDVYALVEDGVVDAVVAANVVEHHGEDRGHDGVWPRRPDEIRPDQVTDGLGTVAVAPRLDGLVQPPQQVRLDRDGDALEVGHGPTRGAESNTDKWRPA